MKGEKIMKKLLSILLIIALSAMLLAGCGNGSANTSEPVQEAADEPAEAETAADPEPEPVISEAPAEPETESAEAEAAEVTPAAEEPSPATAEGPVSEPEAEPAVEPEEAAAEPAVASDAPKKKSKLPVIIAAVLVVAAVAGFLIYNSLPSTKIAKHTKAAYAAYTSADYETALTEIEEIKALDESNYDAFAMQYDVYLERALKSAEAGNITDAVNDLKALSALLKAREETDEQYNFEELEKSVNSEINKLFGAGKDENAVKLLRAKKDFIQGYMGVENDVVAFEHIDSVLEAEADSIRNEDFKAAVDRLKATKELLPEFTEKMDSEISDVYYAWANFAAATYDKEQLEELYGILQEESESYNVEEAKYIVGDTIDSIEERDLMVAFAEDITEYLDNDDLEGATLFMSDELYGIMGDYYKLHARSSAKAPLIVSAGNRGLKVGLYNELFASYIYYGEYDENQMRSGHGVWLSTTKSIALDRIDKYAVGEWKDDAPNGSQSMTEKMTKYGEDTATYLTYNGNVVDGRFDGEIEMLYNNNGYSYYGEAENGKIKILATTDPNGNKNNVIAFTKDRSRWLHNNSAETLVYGLPGF